MLLALLLLTACSEGSANFGEMRRVSSWDPSAGSNIEFYVNVRQAGSQTTQLVTDVPYELHVVLRHSPTLRYASLPARIKVQKVESAPDDGRPVITRTLLARKADLDIRDLNGKPHGETHCGTSTNVVRIEGFAVVFPEAGRYKITFNPDSDNKIDGLLSLGIELIKP